MSAKFSLQSFGPGELSYTFVIETDNGRTLVHPQLPKPAAIRQEPVVIIISDLETSPGKIQRLLLGLLKGEGTFVIGHGLRNGGGGSSVNVLQTVASEQAPGERETAREPLFPPCAAPSSSSLLRSSSRFVCRIFSVLPGIPFTGYTNWGELNLFCSHPR